MVNSLKLAGLAVAVVAMSATASLAASISPTDPQPNFTAQPLAATPGSAPVEGTYGSSANLPTPQGGAYPPTPFSAVPSRGPISYEMVPGGSRYHEVQH